MTTARKGYNGYASYNAWNVALWINNDETLYRMARECLKGARNRTEAAHFMLQQLNSYGWFKTADGVRYSVGHIRGAMAGMDNS